MTDTAIRATDIDPILADHIARPGPLLPILHAVQQAFGFIPEIAITRIAEALNLGRAEVHGVVSFYHDFRSTPGSAHVLRICRAEACQAQGAVALEEFARARLDAGSDGQAAAEGMAVEAVYCLGLCACGPAVQLDGVLHGRVDSARLDRLLAELGR
ncbi:formate dehydrogenase subunit gamma [Pseudooceanicola sp.]|uniref:formate dehydrogenase subunit gamma n=1 Tax=Pseudooceanicola sp. TaxID=1914328 RepID=UPI00261354B0|nr:formate dehydrogenase subunit gamma [Pseudooceanicola sp.]MDF1856886.1 formate dehydrogenase subunit gamma [Pseudooceanicola sp.]